MLAQDADSSLCSCHLKTGSESGPEDEGMLSAARVIQEKITTVASSSLYVDQQSMQTPPDGDVAKDWIVDRGALQ